MGDIGNDRLFLAVSALCEGVGDLRSRVAAAGRIASVIHEDELREFNGLWVRLQKVLAELQSQPPQVHEGEVIADAFDTTARSRENTSCVKYAKEIFDIWRSTCKH